MFRMSISSMSHLVSLNHAQFHDENLDVAELGGGKSRRWAGMICH
jgi:hypothetical protein